MRRVVEPTRILYLDRHLGWSVSLFVSSVFLLAVTPLVRKQKDDPMANLLTLGALALVAAALRLLFCKRAFVADHERGSLLVVERTMFGRRLATFSLGQISIKIEHQKIEQVVKYSHWTETLSSIWIILDGGTPMLFLGDVRGEEGPQLARQLAEDFHCPLHTVERSG